MSNTAALTVLTINDAARMVIDTHVRAARDGRETGGILLGYERPGRIDVSAAGGPGPRADRRSDYFLRDLSHSRRLADDDHRRHGTVWVGEWHTHPYGPAYPSTCDVTTYRELLADDELHLTVFISIIVSGRPGQHPPQRMIGRVVDQPMGATTSAWVVDSETVVETRLNRFS